MSRKTRSSAKKKGKQNKNNDVGSSYDMFDGESYYGNNANDFLLDIYREEDEVTTITMPFLDFENQEGFDFGADAVIKIPPYCYLHVVDRNTNITRTETGPQTFTCLDNEKVIFGPAQFLVIPPRHYCLIENPVIRNKEGEIVKDEYNQPKLNHGDFEVRTDNTPFPLYYGEKLYGSMKKLKIVEHNTALRVRAVRDFLQRIDHSNEKHEDHIDNNNNNNNNDNDNSNNVKEDIIEIYRKAGEEWLFKGPRTYIPRVEEKVVEQMFEIVVKEGQAIKLRARKDFYDERFQVNRLTGDEWLMSDPCSYLPSVDEILIEVQNTIILSEKEALHLRATNNFTDAYGIEREAGEEWLVTLNLTKSHLVDIYEEIVNEHVPIVSLTNREYCIIENPYNDEKKKFEIGDKKLIKGPCNFFPLPPYETVHQKNNVFILRAFESLRIIAKETFEDKIGDGRIPDFKPVIRKAGQQWYFYGPNEYIPQLEVEVSHGPHALIQVESMNLYIFKLSEASVIFLILLIFAYVLFKILLYIIF
eukprot:TRINITY_DN2950_c0_g1_i1.p1 TRINITY_DN2950_c0_g1~~TRINITY_DN2950_c0_g1_i1.p1  ORF type:complete len:530 (-),score=170.31 TRINITY_DN2950_c0_g1_i1:35-1624(-)